MSLRDGNFAVEEDRQPVLATINHPDTQFVRLKTVPIFSFHLLISTIISFIGIILAIKLPGTERCEAYFIMLFLRALFWFITLILDHLIKYEHDKMRLRGHIDFHKAISMHGGMPFYIVTLWNNIIMIIQTLIHYCYGEHFAEHCIQGLFSPVGYMAVFNVTESIFLYAVIGRYIVRVNKFNKSTPPPDALDDFSGNSNITGSVGVHDTFYNISEVLEKQGDFINYLKDRNAHLNQTIIQLSTQIKTLRGEVD